MNKEQLIKENTKLTKSDISLRRRLMGLEKKLNARSDEYQENIKSMEEIIKDLQEKAIAPSISDKLIKNRSAKYGEPEENLSLIALMKIHFWKSASTNPHLANSNSMGSMQASCEILTKIGRIATGQAVEDNWDDIMTYAQIGKNIQFPLEKSEEGN